MADIREYASEQNWSSYSAEEHAVWRLLFDRQQRLLAARACRDYLDGRRGLVAAAAGIPDFAPIYREVAGLSEIAVDALLPGERPWDGTTRGVAGAKKKGRA